MRNRCIQFSYVFVLDPEYVTQERVGINRFGFLLESLVDLDRQLKQKNSRLLVYHGKPENIFPLVFERFQITKLCFESDTEPYARDRDAKIKFLAEKNNIEVIFLFFLYFR